MWGVTGTHSCAGTHHANPHAYVRRASQGGGIVSFQSVAEATFPDRRRAGALVFLVCLPLWWVRRLWTRTTHIPLAPTTATAHDTHIAQPSSHESTHRSLFTTVLCHSRVTGTSTHPTFARPLPRLLSHPQLPSSGPLSSDCKFRLDFRRFRGSEKVRRRLDEFGVFQKLRTCVGGMKSSTVGAHQVAHPS